jgi:hypothetical protein
MVLSASIKSTSITEQISEASLPSIHGTSWGNAELRPQQTLMLQLIRPGGALVISRCAHTTIGRAVPCSSEPCMIDLSPYAGREQGVSRLHAAIEIINTHVTITDLGSANGTFLNGQRLTAYTPRIVRDGDILRFGRLESYIFFSTKSDQTLTRGG